MSELAAAMVVPAMVVPPTYCDLHKRTGNHDHVYNCRERVTTRIRFFRACTARLCFARAAPADSAGTGSALAGVAVTVESAIFVAWFVARPCDGSTVALVTLLPVIGCSDLALLSGVTTAHEWTVASSTVFSCGLLLCVGRATSLLAAIPDDSGTPDPIVGCREASCRNDQIVQDQLYGPAD